MFHLRLADLLPLPRVVIGFTDARVVMLFVEVIGAPRRIWRS
jgi:hypothetical protein